MHKLALEKVSDGGCVIELLKKARSVGFVNVEDVLECIPPEISDPDQVEDIICMIEDMGFTVKGR